MACISPKRFAGEVKDERLQALYAYKAGKELEQNKEKLEQAGKGNLGLNLNVSIGTSKSESKIQSQTTLAQGSTINAGGDINITANNGDITLKGSTAEAENIKLKAEQNINLLAGENKNKTEENTKSSGASIGVSIGLTTGGVGINAGFNKGKGEIKENGTTYTQTQITANDKLQIETGKDLDIIGSKASGNKVEIQVGGNLNIESLQDKQEYDEKNSSVGVNISTDLTNKGKTAIGGGINKSKVESDYQSVTDQAGIYAGQEGFDINVGKNTGLKGAVIASQAEKEKNKLSTETLTYEDIENKAEYNASSVGINVNTSKSADYNEKGIMPNIGVKAQDDANSTTKSAIAEGTVEVRSQKDKDLGDLSRDTQSSLNKLGEIFDKTKVEEQQELANLFGELAFKEIHELSKHQKDKAQKAYDKALSEGAGKEQLDKLKAGITAWDEGGENKILLHSLVGGIMAELGGGNALSGAVGAAVNESLQKQLKEKYKDNPDAWQWVSAIIGGAAGQLAGGDAQTGASTAASGTKNNTQAERDAAGWTAKTEETTDAIEEQIYGTEEIEPGMAEEESQESENTVETNGGYQDEKSQEMANANKPQQEDPAKIEGNIVKEGGKYYRITGGEKAEIAAEEVEGKSRYYVEGQGWFQNINGIDVYKEEGKKQESYIKYIPKEPETLIEKLSGQPIDLVKRAIVGIDESLGFGAGQEIYFQITQKRIDGEETTLYYAGKVLGDGTATIIGTLGIGKGTAEIGGGLVLAPETGGASAAVFLDGVATTVACGKIVQNAAENLGEDWDRLEASMGSGDTSKTNGRFENAPYHGKNGNSVKSKAPKDGQCALDNSVQVKDTSPRRVGVSDGEIVVLDQTRNGIYHGHVRKWEELTVEMQNALKKAGLVDKRGKIIK